MKNVLSAWPKLGKGVLNLIYPLECQICKTGLDPFKKECLCSECKSRIKLNLPPFCLKCGRSLTKATGTEERCRDCRHTPYSFQRSWAVGYYDGVLKKCIHLFKFDGRVGLLPFFGELLLNFTKLYINVNAFDVIVPVPLHKTKMRERTFNQAELLAKDYSLKAGIPLDANNLIKVKHTPAQTDLSRYRRLLNIRDAFRVVDPSSFKNKNILLMDDVFTTGSTLNECAKILLDSGADTVACLVLARG